MMDQYQLIAVVLWTGLALALLAAVAAPFASIAGHRLGALALLGVATIYLLGFSFVGGFSIGRGTVLLPLIFTACAVALGRGRSWLRVCLLTALGGYVVVSWLLLPVYFAIAGSPLGFLEYAFGFDAIPLYTAAALAGFTWTVLNPPASAERPGPPGPPSKPARTRPAGRAPRAG